MARRFALADMLSCGEPEIPVESVGRPDASGDPLGAPPFATAPRPSLATSGWRALSLFAGCGGFDLGFGQEGIGASLALDVDRTCIESWQRNSDGRAVVRDLNGGLDHMPVADVLIAGAPCQGFSTIGKRNPGDNRNELLRRVADVANVVSPRVVIVENVPAALSGSQRTHWLQLEERLRCSGFQIRRVTLDAADYGVAQHRRRLFLVAWRGSPHVELRLTGAASLDVRGAFGLLAESDEPGEMIHLSDRMIARSIGQGQKLSNVRFGPRNVHTWEIPAVFGRTDERDRQVLTAIARLRRRGRVRETGDGDPVILARLEAETGFSCGAIARSLVTRGYLKPKGEGFELFHTYNGKFRRLASQGCSPTVDTHFGTIRNFVHPDHDRAMTLRETMRLQGFPDWFKLSSARSPAFRMIGNAVPPPLGAALARFVREAILKA